MNLKTICVLVVAGALTAGLALAHGPRFHNARLVEFNRPLPAPGFTLRDPDGKSISLSDFRGKFVLLNFWATWCPPCVKEMPSMDRLADKLAQWPFVVLGISLDEEGAEKVKPFLARLGVRFPIALDPRSEVSSRYGARDLPSTFLINPEGNVIAAAKGEREWDSKEMVEYLTEVVAAKR